MKHEESKIQTAIMAYLSVALPATYRALAIPNGGKRDLVTGAILKREGVKAGTPDILIVGPDGCAAFLEVKREGGRLSAEQVKFRDWCGANRVPFAVVRSVSDVDETLLEWNVPLKARAAA